MILLFRQVGVLTLVATAVACSNSSQAVDAPAGAAAGAPAGAATAAPPGAVAGPAEDVRKFTGAPTKVVWVQSDGSDPFAAGDQLVLMGFSTEDGKGERVILGKRQSYVKPLLTPRGDRLVFSTRPQGEGPEVFTVGWDGAGLTRLAKGFALAVWEDPMGGVPWVYVGSGNKDKSYDFPVVSRFPIDAPTKTEVVWNTTLVSADTFQLSADGRFAAGLFPWPRAGIADLANKSWEPIGEGCWTAMTTARGPIAWYFDGAHRNITLVDMRTKKRWTVALNQAPGFQNPEVYHPRWTNHPRFIALSGPYNQGGANQVRSGGTQSEVWLGRFSEDFSRVEAWTRVTSNSGGDSYPDIWIDRDKSSFPARPAGAIGPATATPAPAPGTAKPQNAAATRAVVEVRLAHAGPIPTPESILPYRHALVVNAYDVVKVVEGQYGEKTIHVAQWAIRDGKVLADAKRTAGATARLIVERYDAHPELEGERLITDLGSSPLPLYLAIKP
jgi:hypothetical protein